jgi:RHS repeat-associated protein
MPPKGTTFQNYANAVLEPARYETSLAYDALNRIASMRYPRDVEGQRKLLRPRYNQGGGLERVELDGAPYVERIAYNARGQRLLVVYGNGLMTRHAYDPRSGRLARLRTERYASPAALTYRPDGTLLQDYAYGYDLASNIIALSDRTPGAGLRATPDRLDRGFAYDPLYRLRSATGRECDVPPPLPPWTDVPRCADLTREQPYTETYDYDPLGNLTALQHQATGGFTRTYALAAGSNRLAKVTVGPTPKPVDYAYVYDAAGNLTQEASERFFEWDHSDRMISFRTQTRAPKSKPADNRWSEPTVHAHYLYDASGQRVKKLVRKQGGAIEVTVYVDGLFEDRRDVQKTATVRNSTLHVLDGTKRIAQARVGPTLAGDGRPPVTYELADHLGSSSVVVDQYGKLVNREEYTPYGETSFGSFARKRYRFAGKERDEESGLAYHGARYYAPWLMRWVSRDVAGTRDGPNLYWYARGNPLNLVDVSGLSATKPPTGGSADYKAADLHATGQENYETERRAHTARAAKEKGISGEPFEHHHHADVKAMKEVGLNPDIGGESSRMSVVHSRRDPVVRGAAGDLPHWDPAFEGKVYTHHNIAKHLDKAAQARVPKTPAGLADASAESKKYWPSTADYADRSEEDWMRVAITPDPKGSVLVHPATEPQKPLPGFQGVEQGPTILPQFPTYPAMPWAEEFPITHEQGPTILPQFPTHPATPTMTRESIEKTSLALRNAAMAAFMTWMAVNIAVSQAFALVGLD